jgi:hypothetical protein
MHFLGDGYSKRSKYYIHDNCYRLIEEALKDSIQGEQS